MGNRTRGEPSFKALMRWSGLDRTTLPAFVEQIGAYSPDAWASACREYPGHPTWPLPRVKARLWPSLDRALERRASERDLGVAIPAPRALSRLLWFAHGAMRDGDRGPTPTAGALNGIELYVAVVGEGWLPSGLYHYDRKAHHLAQLAGHATREEWRGMVPSLQDIRGGSLVWVLVGDGNRVTAKYGQRAFRFLLLEAGHLMQNLCVLSSSLGLSTTPCGGFLEREIGRALRLPPDDEVLYVGVCGPCVAAGRGRHGVAR